MTGTGEAMHQEDNGLGRLLPPVTERNQPYWEGCATGELRLQCCTDCGTYRYPDSPCCPRCLSRSAKWMRVSGRGELWSFAVFHQRYFDELADRLPYPVLWVRLEEGPFMITGLDGDVSDLEIGQRLEVSFQQVGEDRFVPNFKVAR